MNKVLKVAVMCLLSTVVFSQSEQAMVSNLGVFKYFNEFRINQPSVKGEFNLVPFGRGYGKENENPHSFYQLNYEKDSVDLSECIPWGVFDGENYYRFLEVIGNRFYFERIVVMGRYCAFYKLNTVENGKYNSPLKVKKGNVSIHESPGFERERLTIIIDMNTGKEFGLDEALMYNILREEQDLFESFRKEQNKEEVLLEYLESFNSRNDDELR